MHKKVNTINTNINKLLADIYDPDGKTIEYRIKSKIQLIIQMEELSKTLGDSKIISNDIKQIEESIINLLKEKYNEKSI